MSNRILVAYFSASGTTARLSWIVLATTEGKAATPELTFSCISISSAADLDWTNKKSRSSVEMNDPACRPAIAAPVENMDQYDTVFLGFPIWWYVEPRIVDTFLEGHALAGKRVIPFATSGGSGIDGATRSLQSHCPQAKWVQGQVLHGNPAAWAKRVLAG